MKKAKHFTTEELRLINKLWDNEPFSSNADKKNASQKILSKAKEEFLGKVIVRKFAWFNSYQLVSKVEMKSRLNGYRRAHILMSGMSVYLYPKRKGERGAFLGVGKGMVNKSTLYPLDVNSLQVISVEEFSKLYQDAISKFDANCLTIDKYMANLQEKD